MSLHELNEAPPRPCGCPHMNQQACYAERFGCDFETLADGEECDCECHAAPTGDSPHG